MKTIAHVSDLHFGREDPVLAEALLADIVNTAPSVVAVSGDLTQRARPREFEAARAWLARLTAPAIVVPGNHDVPLFDLWTRFTAGLSRFRRHIEPDPYPFHGDDELAVLGISTARSFTLSGGWITGGQAEDVRARLSAAPASAFRVLVTHHQFVPHPHRPASSALRRVEHVLDTIERSGVDLLLAGHVHLGYWGDVREHHVALRRSILFVQAGTATSHRRRGEPNAWNLIHIEADHVQIEARVWDGRRYEPRAPVVFRRSGGEWKVLL